MLGSLAGLQTPPSPRSPGAFSPPGRLVVVLAIGLGTALHAVAASPADPLLALVPAEAGAILVVENLDAHLGMLAGTRLARDLQALPAIRAWQTSDRYAQLQRARREIEQVLGVPSLGQAGRELFGTAFVLALVQPPDSGPEKAQGLLIVPIKDRALVERILNRLNEAERAAGTLKEIREDRHRGVPYHVRTFQAGAKPDESYVILDEGLFAWSNSEELIRGLLDRRAEGNGLAELPGFRAVRAALPADPLASLFVHPEFLLRQLPRPGRRESIASLARRILGASEYLGAALQWRDGLILHCHEALDPGRLDPPLRDWAATSSASAADPFDRVPASAIAAVSGPIDVPALVELAGGFVPELDRPRMEALALVLKGLLLGQDARQVIAPRLGPDALAYLDRSGSADPLRFPFVLSLSLNGTDDQLEVVRPALANGLRTIIALAALEEKVAVPRRVELLDHDRVVGAALRTSTGQTLFAFAVGERVVALGNEVEAVLAATTAGRDPAWRNRLDLPAEALPSRTRLAIDLDALTQLARTHRVALVRRLGGDRPEDEALRDLDQALGLLQLFRVAYATHTVEADARAAHQVMGLVGRENEARPAR